MALANKTAGIAWVLLALMCSADWVPITSTRIIPAPRHVEIANRISTHREAVTREFNRLSRIGIIERRGGELLVKDIDRLATMVHEATGELAGKANFIGGVSQDHSRLPVAHPARQISSETPNVRFGSKADI